MAPRKPRNGSETKTSEDVNSRTVETSTASLSPHPVLASPAQMVLIPRSVAPLLHAVALASLTNSFRLLNVPGPIKDFTDSQYGGHFVFLTVQG
jgi:hypothetical protein